MVEKKTPCPCGCKFQAVERIEGRCDDLLYVESLNGEYKPLFPDFVSRKIISVSDQITEYEVVQEAPNQWKIFLDPQFREKVYEALTALFVKIQCHIPEITFVDKPFRKKPGAKFRRIRRSYAAV